MVDKKTKDVTAQVAERVRREEEKLRQEAAQKDAAENRKPVAVRQLEISDSELLGYLNENRIGDAKLYCRLHRGTVVYVKYWERFLVWVGHHWAEDHYDRAFSKVEDVCALYLRLEKNKRAEAAEATDKDERSAIEAVADMAKRRVALLRDKNGQDNILLMLRRVENPLTVLPKLLDKKHYLKACPNGVIDLRTGELLPGNPEDFLLHSIATEYDPELIRQESSPCPAVDAYLLASMDGDQELVEYIWRLLGSALITKRRDHVFVIFHGEHGRNGKDTLIKLITHVLGGELSGDVPVEMFLQTSQVRNSSAPSPDVLMLRGMCIAWINEAEGGQKFALSKLKKLTGGGFITARGLQDKAMTTWEQTHTPIMTTNELPSAKADDAAFWCRTQILKWPLSFVDEPKESYEREADKNLDEKLQAEAKGVLARMVKGGLQVLKDGRLLVPEKIKQWTNEQRESWDDVGVFLNEWCIIEDKQEDTSRYKTKIEASELHKAFCLWYQLYRGAKAIQARTFGILLNKKEIPVKRSNGSWRLGVSLKVEAIDALRDAGGKDY